MKRILSLVCGLMVASGTLPAQQVQRYTPREGSQQAAGAVTGHVYCRDTQRPARFADVELLRQSTNDSGATSYQGAGRARTALDGSFVINGVAPGEYYVAAQLTGYVSASAVARLTQKPIAGAPLARVDVNRSADVQVVLERGAVVTGRVTYDDGTPIPGVPVRLRTADSSASTANQRGGFGAFGAFSGSGDFGSGQTDDRGVFRASGIPPGRYVVSSIVQTETTGRVFSGGRGGDFRGGGFPTFLSVYAPATMHKPSAHVVEIRGSETIDGIDIQVALAGLHVLQGSVLAKSDSHPVNSGLVALTDTADASFSRTSIIEPDGTFRLEYLPAGNYSLRVQGQDRTISQDRNQRGGDRKQYEPATSHRDGRRARRYRGPGAGG